MDRTDEDRANRIEVWEDPDGTKHVKCEFTFTPTELVGMDLHPADKVMLGYLDHPDASLGNMLEALAILVQAKTPDQDVLA